MLATKHQIKLLESGGNPVWAFYDACFAKFDRLSISTTACPVGFLINLPAAEQPLSTLTELVKNLIQFRPRASKPRPDHAKPHRKYFYKSPF